MISQFVVITFYILISSTSSFDCQSLRSVGHGAWLSLAHGYVSLVLIPGTLRDKYYAPQNLSQVVFGNNL